MSGTTDKADVPRQPRQSKHKREAIVRAALDLFSVQGYESVTVDRIAERAGVSRRTFFDYFPAKDALLFAVRRGTEDRLANLVAEQPLHLDALTAIERAWTDVVEWTDDVPDIEGQRHRVELLLKAADASFVLRGKQYEAHATFERALARGLARRHGRRKPLADDVLAAVIGQAVLSVAVTRWAGDPRLDRRETIAEAFSSARAIVAGNDPNVQGRS